MSGYFVHISAVHTMDAFSVFLISSDHMDHCLWDDFIKRYIRNASVTNCPYIICPYACLITKNVVVNDLNGKKEESYCVRRVFGTGCWGGGGLKIGNWVTAKLTTPKTIV